MAGIARQMTENSGAEKIGNEAAVRAEGSQGCGGLARGAV